MKEKFERSLLVNYTPTRIAFENYWFEEEKNLQAHQIYVARQVAWRAWQAHDAQADSK
jgi:hypothetical protein